MRTPDVGCCTQHESQHESFGYCVRREGPLMLNIARNMLAT
jgi:hypothetical protein